MRNTRAGVVRRYAAEFLNVWNPQRWSWSDVITRDSRIHSSLAKGSYILRGLNIDIAGTHSVGGKTAISLALHTYYILYYSDLVLYSIR
jgi:hypothetical protein